MFHLYHVELYYIVSNRNKIQKFLCLFFWKRKFILLVMNYKIDQLFFVNVLIQLNVDEYSQPYVVILLLDVILFLNRNIRKRKSIENHYRHHLKKQIHVQHGHDQLLYMLYKLRNIRYTNEKLNLVLLGILQVAQKYFNVSFLCVGQNINRRSLPLESSSFI